jgi:hypothetical protein
MAEKENTLKSKQSELDPAYAVHLFLTCHSKPFTAKFILILSIKQIQNSLCMLYFTMLSAATATVYNYLLYHKMLQGSSWIKPIFCMN